MMYLEFNKNSQEPLYIQIFNQIVVRIHSGDLKPGTKLPSQRKMAEEMNVSVNTIVNAYNLLVQYEFVESRNRSGYYINEGNCPQDLYPERRWHSSIASIYNFSKNGVDLKMSNEFKKSFRQTIKSFTDSDFMYPDYTGAYDLRKQICSMLNKNYDIACEPTQIVVGAGLNYLLGSLIRIMPKNLTYAFENPTYYKVSDFMRLGEEKKTFFNVTTEGIQKEDLDNLDEDVLFLMPYHHYSLGYSMSDEQKRDVLKWANKNRYLIEYAIDIDFVYKKTNKTLYSMTENKNVIFMGDFNKSLAPSFTVAYMVLPEPLVKRWQDVYLSYHSLASKFEQDFLNEVLKNGSYFRNLKRLKNEYNKKRKCLISAIKRHNIGDKIEILNFDSGTTVLIKPMTDCSEEDLIVEAHKAGVKLSYVKNALEIQNERISPKLFILGYGELKQDEIESGIKLLLDTWEMMI